MRTVGGLVAGAVGAQFARSEELPLNTNPRAIFGDSTAEPDWNQRLVVTVGPDKADLVDAPNGKLVAAGRATRPRAR